MDIQQYINSGNLELYVLGRLDPSAMREVERYAQEYPEIQDEIRQIELALEAYAEANAGSHRPRADLLPPLLAAITGGASLSSAAGDDTDNDPPPPPSGSAASGSGLWSWFPWVLAIVAGALALYLSTVNGRTTEELTSLQSRYAALEAACDSTQTALQAAETRLLDVANSATQDVILAGTDNAPQANALVLYNQATNKTFFRASNLPPPPSGKQYQLWAIDADGPKDLGVLAADLSGETLLEVQYLPGVATFAITLEDAGGKPQPDLSQLQVIGNV